MVGPRPNLREDYTKLPDFWEKSRPRAALETVDFIARITIFPLESGLDTKDES